MSVRCLFGLDFLLNVANVLRCLELNGFCNTVFLSGVWIRKWQNAIAYVLRRHMGL